MAIGGAREEKAHLLQLNDIGLRVSLGHAVGTTVDGAMEKLGFAENIGKLALAQIRKHEVACFGFRVSGLGLNIWREIVVL